ncbi:MAG TPA: fibronectin type III domain-containing protein [Acetobacteraceae bacterium]
MSIYPPTPGTRAQAVMMPTTQLVNPAPAKPLTTPPATPQGPSLVQSGGSDLVVIWAAPAVDSNHGAATAFNLQFRPSGGATWTIVANVSSPYDLSGLPGGTAIDVQIQSENAAGVSAWSATSTLTTGAGPAAPNQPSITAVAPPPDGTAGALTVNWTAPATDSAHGPAAGYNLRYSASGAGNWTTVPGVASPCTITGLAGATAIEVELQAIDAAGSPGAWSASVTGITWGATVVPSNWIAAATQVHGTSVAPNGGVNMTATAAPTAVTGAAFAWSDSPSAVPVTNLIAAGPDGQPNGWGAFLDAPATPGTFYLWMLAQGSGGATIGALVSPAITVS